MLLDIAEARRAIWRSRRHEPKLGRMALANL
jgi:hypothetical protein